MNRQPLGTINNTPTISQDNAKNVAHTLWDKYSTAGSMQQNSLVSMIIDAYKPIVFITYQKPSHYPSQNQIQTYSAVLDNDKDGKITKKDFQALALRYFCGVTSQTVTKKPALQRKLTKTAKQRLAVAVRIFKKYDDDNSGYLQENQVPRLIQQTYRIMGINYHPTRQDVLSWMKMTDTDGDGKVTIDEYQNLVIRSLQRYGIQIYQ